MSDQTASSARDPHAESCECQTCVSDETLAWLDPGHEDAYGWKPSEGLTP